MDALRSFGAAPGVDSLRAGRAFKAACVGAFKGVLGRRGAGHGAQRAGAGPEAGGAAG